MYGEQPASYLALVHQAGPSMISLKVHKDEDHSLISTQILLDKSDINAAQ